MTYKIEDVSPELIAEILDRNPLQPFNEGDWYAFRDCDSDNPRIAYEDNLAIIFDGKVVQVIDYESKHADFVDFNTDEIEALIESYEGAVWAEKDDRRFDGR